MAARVVGYLGLALLPLGLISLLQARVSQDIGREQAELALVALTEQSVDPLALTISRAIGATQALALSKDLLLQSEGCVAAVQRFVADDGPFDYVRFFPPVEAPTCDVGTQPAGMPGTPRADASGAPRIDILPSPANPQALGVDLAFVPDADDDASMVHLYAAVSLGPDSLPRLPSSRRGVPLALVVFASDGQPLTWLSPDRGFAEQPGALPAARDLADLAEGGSRFFEARSQDGQALGYTVVPVSDGLVYALAAWQGSQSGRPTGVVAQAPLAFPALMWTMSLAVAVWALGRLVVRPVRELARRMNLFGSDRTLVEDPLSGDLTRELREIDSVFREMASSVVRDEARMRSALDERSALLREVHHRVKNNLQLISSILSMQLRRVDDPDVKAMLRRLQDRVLTLAAIYRALYTSADMTDVNVAPILRQIVEREVDAFGDGVSVTVEMDDLRLDADKVVPLVFLAAEAVSNAMAAVESGEGRLIVRLQRHADGRATLAVDNDVRETPETQSRHGLGAQLMSAFAAQIGAPIRSGVEDGMFRVSITFDADRRTTVAEPEMAPAQVMAS